VAGPGGGAEESRREIGVVLLYNNLKENENRQQIEEAGDLYRAPEAESKIS